MTEPTVWIYISSDNQIRAFDTQSQAISAAADDPGDVWIEEVTLNRSATEQPVERSHSPEPSTDVPAEGSTPQTGAQRRRTWLAPPILSVDGRWINA